MFDPIIRILKKPFPEIESRLFYYKYLTILSVFVAFFLYIFQPFGISTIESNKFLICLGFGGTTFLGALIYELSVGKLLQLMSRGLSWTFGKWIVNNLGIVLFVSMANFIFIRLFHFGYIDWELFPPMLYGTFMVGIIPVVGLGAIILQRQEKKFQDIAEEINQNPANTPALNQTNEKSIFNIPTGQIKYIEALQNYVKIGYINAEGKLKEQTERATLKRIMEEGNGSPISKCHRSFLVNKEAIISTAGNAQGLLLTLSECEKVIPVSRNYVADFRKQ